MVQGKNEKNLTLEERLQHLCIDEIKIKNWVFTVLSYSSIGYQYTLGASGNSIAEALDNFEQERKKNSKA